MKLWLFIFCLLFTRTLHSQLTLPAAIKLANKKSFGILSAENNLNLAILTYQAYKIAGKPSINFYGNAPVYNKDNYAVTQPDGSIRFLPRSQNYSNVGIGFSQPITSTGGTISVNTDLYRFDNFTDKTKQYNGTPFFIRLSQPLFNYNSYKWDKKTAPVKLQEATQQQKLQLLQTAYEVCKLFFDVAEAQINEELAVTNLANATTNLTIEKRRVQLGASTEDKVMQLEMQELNSLQNKAVAVLAIQKGFLLLHSYTNNGDTAFVKLSLPTAFPAMPTDKERLISLARKNHPDYLLFERKKLEASSKLEEAKKQGRQIDLVASYGFNNAAAELGAIYNNPQNQQRFSIGFNIPIADWGRRKNNLQIATTTAEELAITQQQTDAKLVADIAILVNELPLLKNNIQQAILLDTLSSKRFVIANRLFQAGKVSLLELQAAQTEKDNAKRNYIISLRRFWEAWYLLRLVTGTDEI